ncbi:hypothetical protein AKJ47_01635 [candidate division MSBL1 archaeon SCGC-AAA261G05]|uniref:Carbohydrate kinase PfkB domain-containing protein n=2 Tax=candidate division MSBL1 TaxID=215777 RepID=A0A133VBR1_9EURY|nr:hypothetical protein AKJ48_03790 [candidate division MSBL1 archaeon SCGC-AAA261O19]KXB03824.1 hypothetical protein AKJ47_01635 [candidate division MSBL1 archaeon SCGC-AAA261G05]
MSIKLITVGDANVDFIVSVNSLPEKGGETRVPTFEMHAGGSAANTCVAAQRLGLKSGFIGRVGSEFFGRFLKREFRKEGVDISQLQTDGKVNSGFMFIMTTPDGERTMLCSRGANTRLALREIDTDYVKDTNNLHISGYSFLEPPQRDAVRQVVKVAENEDCQISLDPGILALKESLEEIESIMPSVDLLFLNKRELRILSDIEDIEVAGRQFLEMGPSTVVLKLGGEGCLALAKGRKSFAKAFPINIVDTTGAGDAFDATFIVGLERGWDLNKITKFANATGAISATKIGARSALPTFSEVEKFLSGEAGVEN